MLDLRKIIFIVILTAIGLGYWQYTRMEKKVETAQKNEATNQVVGEINKAGAITDAKSDKINDAAIVDANTNVESTRNDQDSIKLKAEKELRKIELSTKPKSPTKSNITEGKDKVSSNSPINDFPHPLTFGSSEHRESLEKKSEVYIDSLWEAYATGNAAVKAASI
jgi:hypothetical protein